MIGIYKITSPSGKIYIGQSINIKRRILGYKNKWYKGSLTKLFSSFVKYGVERHIFEVVEECAKEELNDRERYYQMFFECCGDNGLNLMFTSTKDKSGEMSKEAVRKMSIKLLGNKRKLGWKASDEVRRKISEAKLGSIAWNKGIKRTEAELTLMSKNRKGVMCAEDNYNSKVILNILTGVFYYGAKEASDSCSNFKHHNLKDRFRGKVFNNSPFVQV